MPAQTVLEELTEDHLTREHVERRIEDWVRRVEQLFADVIGWLPEGWTAQRVPLMPMNEPLMRSFGIAPRAMDMLELVRDGKIEARLRPYGLWIIGANGRIDLVVGSRLYFLVDRSRLFAQPEWCIAPLADRRRDRSFDRAEFLLALNEP